MSKTYCPFTRQNCMKEKCELWKTFYQENGNESHDGCGLIK